MNLFRSPNSRRVFAWTTMLLLVSGASLFGEPTEAKPAATTDGQAANPAQSAKKHIYAGMPAAELQTLIGKPDKIVPVPTKSGQTGQVEIWQYRRLLRSSTETVTVGTKSIMGRRPNGDGTFSDYVMATEPVYKNRVTTVYKVASFLIANGQYVTTTQSEEKQEYFE